MHTVTYSRTQRLSKGLAIKKSNTDHIVIFLNITELVAILHQTNALLCKLEPDAL